MKNILIGALVVALVSVSFILGFAPTRNAIFGIETTLSNDGKSAYELAVENGFEGTLDEWLESLKGQDGTNGVDGINGVDGVNGQNGTNGTNGTNGQDGKDGIDGVSGSMTLLANENKSYGQSYFTFTDTYDLFFVYFSDKDITQATLTILSGTQYTGQVGGAHSNVRFLHISHSINNNTLGVYAEQLNHSDYGGIQLIIYGVKFGGGA